MAKAPDELTTAVVVNPDAAVIDPATADDWPADADAEVLATPATVSAPPMKSAKPAPRKSAAKTKSSSGSTGQKVLVAGGVAAAAAGAAFLLSRKGRTGPNGPVISDAPAWTLKKATKQAARPIAAKTLLIGRPREELYAVWKDYARFPEFMENVQRIEQIDPITSRWSIRAPANQIVTLVTKISEDIPGRKISWQSEPDSQIKTSGQVEFEDATGGRGTFVSLVMSYEPPAGRVGQVVAKLFGREPNIQARHDLRRFKQLMETGEVTTNASPSARKSESPVQPRH